MAWSGQAAMGKAMRAAVLGTLLCAAWGWDEGRAAAQASSAGVSKAGADAQRLAEAQKHMDAGAALYNDPKGPKCEEAYQEFKKAHELSGSVKALRAMGICAEELERDGLAIEHFEMCLELAQKGTKLSAEDKAQIESDLKGLKAAAAQVSLSADREGVRVRDVRAPAKGAEVSNAYEIAGPAGTEQALKIHPGRHRFTAKAADGAELIWEAELENGGTYTHRFVFAELERKTDTQKPRMERPVPVSAMVMGGVTAALLVPTVVLMVRAKGKGSDYEESNGKLPVQQLEEMRSGVVQANLLSDVFLGATVVAGAVTAVLFVTRPSKPVSEANTWTLRPMGVGLGGMPRGLMMEGRF